MRYSHPRTTAEVQDTANMDSASAGATTMNVPTAAKPPSTASSLSTGAGLAWDPVTRKPGTASWIGPASQHRDTSTSGSTNTHQYTSPAPEKNGTTQLPHTEESRSLPPANAPWIGQSSQQRDTSTSTSAKTKTSSTSTSNDTAHPTSQGQQKPGAAQQPLDGGSPSRSVEQAIEQGAQTTQALGSVLPSEDGKSVVQSVATAVSTGAQGASAIGNLGSQGITASTLTGAAQSTGQALSTLGGSQVAQIGGALTGAAGLASTGLQMGSALSSSESVAQTNEAASSTLGTHSTTHAVEGASKSAAETTTSTENALEKSAPATHPSEATESSSALQDSSPAHASSSANDSSPTDGTQRAIHQQARPQGSGDQTSGHEDGESSPAAAKDSSSSLDSSTRTISESETRGGSTSSAISTAAAAVATAAVLGMGASLEQTAAINAGRQAPPLRVAVTPQQGSSSRAPAATTSATNQPAAPASGVTFTTGGESLRARFNEVLADMKAAVMEAYGLDSTTDDQQTKLLAIHEVMEQMERTAASPFVSTDGQDLQYVIMNTGGQPTALAIMALTRNNGELATYLNDLVTAPWNVVKEKMEGRPDRIGGVAKHVVEAVSQWSHGNGTRGEVQLVSLDDASTSVYTKLGFAATSPGAKSMIYTPGAAAATVALTSALAAPVTSLPQSPVSPGQQGTSTSSRAPATAPLTTTAGEVTIHVAGESRSVVHRVGDSTATVKDLLGQLRAENNLTNAKAILIAVQPDEAARAAMADRLSGPPMKVARTVKELSAQALTAGASITLAASEIPLSIREPGLSHPELLGRLTDAHTALPMPGGIGNTVARNVHSGIFTGHFREGALSFSNESRADSVRAMADAVNGTIDKARSDNPALSLFRAINLDTGTPPNVGDTLASPLPSSVTLFQEGAVEWGSERVPYEHPALLEIQMPPQGNYLMTSYPDDAMGSNNKNLVQDMQSLKEVILGSHNLQIVGSESFTDGHGKQWTKLIARPVPMSDKDVSRAIEAGVAHGRALAAAQSSSQAPTTTPRPTTSPTPDANQQGTSSSSRAPAGSLQVQSVDVDVFREAVMDMYVEALDASSDLSADASNDRARQTLESGIKVMEQMLQQTSPEFLATVSDPASSDSHRYMIVKNAGEATGLAILHQTGTGAEQKTFLNDLVTAPWNVVPIDGRPERVGGVAQSVINAASQWSLDNGTGGRVDLVSLDEASTSVYQRLGFVPTGAKSMSYTPAPSQTAAAPTNQQGTSSSSSALDAPAPAPSPAPATGALRPEEWAARRDTAPVAHVATERFDPRRGAKLAGDTTHVRYDVSRIEVRPGQWVQELTLKLQLDPTIAPPPGASAATAEQATALQESLAQTIADHVNGRHTLPNGDQFHLRVEFDAPSPHAVIGVHTGDPGTEQLRWNADASPTVLLHEALHFLGLPDEYVAADMVFRATPNLTITAPDGSRTTLPRTALTNELDPAQSGLMGIGALDATPTLPARYFQAIADVMAATTVVHDAPLGAPAAPSNGTGQPSHGGDQAPTPGQGTSARAPQQRPSFAGLVQKAKTLSKLVKIKKQPATPPQSYLDPNQLLTGSSATTWNTTHLQWYLDQATLLGATPTGPNAAATKKQLEMLALHSFYKAAQIDQVRADSRQTQITPFLNRATVYHRSSSSPLLDRLHTAYETKLGVPSGALHIVDNATFSTVLAREYPAWGQGATAPQTTQQFESAVTGLLAQVNAPGSTITGDPALLDVSALLAAKLNGAPFTSTAADELVAELEDAFLGQVTQFLAAQQSAAAALGQTFDANGFLGKLASVLPGQQISAFTEHLGSTLLITPKFLAGQDATAPALQRVGSDAERTALTSLFTPANASKDVTLGRALDTTLIKSGYRVDPASAMEAWLAVEDAATILANQNIPLATLATKGTTIPTVHGSFQSFLGSVTMTQFTALGTQPGLTQLPYVTVLTEGTVALLEGLRHAGVDAAFNARGLQDLLQTSYFRIEEAMHEAIAFPTNFTRFLNQIELINQELSTFLEIAQPYNAGDFQTALLGHLGNTIPAGLSAQAELHPSALHSLASTLASVEALKGTNALQVMVLDNSYYESGLALDHAKTYTLSHLDGVPLQGKQPFSDKVVADLKASGTKLDVFLGEFRHNISETLESYGVEDLEHQVDQLFEHDLVSDQLTVVIDNTIDKLKSSQVQSFLEHNRQRITDGKLNVVVFRSAQKFDMVGLDNYYGGSVYTVNDPTSFQGFNDRLGDPTDRLGGLNRQGLTHLVTSAAPSLDAYRGAIMGNTSSLYSQLPAAVKVTPGSTAATAPVQVSRIDGDDKQVFLDIKFNDISYKDTFVNKLSELIRQQGFAVDQRPSFGFAMSNLLTIFDKKMRFNPGLEGPAQIAQYASFFAKWQSIIDAGRAAGKTGAQIRTQLASINSQRLVYSLESDPAVEANVQNLIGKKQPFNATGPAKGPHIRVSDGQLSSLDAHDKLTIVGHGGATTFAGKTAGELAAHLAQKGVTALGTLSLKGCDSAAFARDLLGELQAQGITVGRITGRDGEVTITSSGRTLVRKDASWMHQAPGTKQEITSGSDGSVSAKDALTKPGDPRAIEARSQELRGQINAGTLPQRDYKSEIENEFKRFVYIRKTRRGDDELQFNVAPRAAYYDAANTAQTGQESIESNYWHATSAVRAGVPIQLYDSFSSTGLVLSGASTELGGFGKRDLGLPTKNVPRGEYPSNFRQRANPFSNGKTLTTSDDVAAKLAEMASRHDGTTPDVSTSGKPRSGTLLMDFNDGEGLQDVGAEKEPYFGATSIPYNEAQVHYKPSDILGVYYDNTPEARADAIRMQSRLRDEHGIDVPFVRYEAGEIHVSTQLPEQDATTETTDSPAAPVTTPRPPPTPVQMRDVSIAEFAEAVGDMRMYAWEAERAPDTSAKARKKLQASLKVFERMADEASNPSTTSADTRRHVIVERDGEPVGLAILTLRPSGNTATYLDDLVTAPWNIVPSADRPAPAFGLAQSVVNEASQWSQANDTGGRVDLVSLDDDSTRVYLGLGFTRATPTALAMSYVPQPLPSSPASAVSPTPNQPSSPISASLTPAPAPTSGFVRVSARPATPEQAPSERASISWRARFTSFVKNTARSFWNLVKRGKPAATTPQRTLDPNRLLAARPDGATGAAWNTTHLQWYLDQAMLLGSNPTGPNAAETRKQLEMLVLHSFHKAAQIEQVRADSQGRQITPFLNQSAMYHRSTGGNRLLDEVHVAYEANLGFRARSPNSSSVNRDEPTGVLHLVDNATFGTVLAREYPSWDMGSTTPPGDFPQFEAAVDRFLDRIASGPPRVGQAILDVSALLEAELEGASISPAAVDQLVSKLESTFLDRTTRLLASDPAAAAAILGKLLPALADIHVAAFTKHDGRTLLITPKFLAGNDALAPALQHVQSEQDRQMLAQVFASANASKHDDLTKEIDTALMKSGYRVDPASAMEAWLAVEDLATILARENIPLTTLATGGGSIPTVHETFQKFLDGGVLTSFAARGQGPRPQGEPPYVTVLTRATSSLLAGLAGKDVDTAFTSRGLGDLLQTSYFRIEEAMREAMAFPGDFTRFLNQIEIIHQELSMLLEIARPYDDGAFQTGLLAHLGDTIPDGLSTVAQLHPSAMHSLASTLAGVEATKGTNALNVLLLKDTYYESGMALDHASTYALTRLDGDALHDQNALTPEVVKGLSGEGKKLDVFIGEFRHNITENRTVYKVEDLEHQIDQLFANNLVSDKFTVVIDNTIDELRSSNVQSFLAHNAERIRDGKLNVVVFRSAQKFDMVGLDNYYGGSVFAVNKPESFGAFNQRLDHPDDRLQGLNRQGLTHLVTSAAPSLDSYRGAIMDNTRTLYGNLPAELKNDPATPLAPGATQTPMQVSMIAGDDKQVFLDINFHDDGYRGTFTEAFSKFAAKQGLQLGNRSSFGFAMSNLLDLGFMKKIRFNPGLEGAADMDKIAAFFTKWQAIVGSGLAAGKPSLEIKSQLLNMNHQRLVYTLESDPAVEANVRNLIAKKRPFDPTGPAKGPHIRVSEGGLGSLDAQDKLTIVGHGGASTFAGKTAGELATHLAQAGVTALGTLSLKGCDSTAFASSLMGELKARGITVGRITGRDGKVTITSRGRTLVSGDASDPAAWMHQAPGTKQEITSGADGSATSKDAYAHHDDAAAVETASQPLRTQVNAGVLPASTSAQASSQEQTTSEQTAGAVERLTQTMLARSRAWSNPRTAANKREAIELASQLLGLLDVATETVTRTAQPGDDSSEGSEHSTCACSK